MLRRSLVAASFLALVGGCQATEPMTVDTPVGLASQRAQPTKPRSSLELEDRARWLASREPRFSEVADLVNEERWEEVEESLAQAMDPELTPELRTVASALLAATLVREGKKNEAGLAYLLAVHSWGATKSPILRAVTLDDSLFENDRDLLGPDPMAYSSASDETLRACEAVAEALLFLADETLSKGLLAAPFPRLDPVAGPGEKEQLLAYADQKVGPWIARREALLEKVGNWYRLMSMVEPGVPNSAMVVAAERYGTAWEESARELSGAPLQAQRMPEDPERRNYWGMVRAKALRMEQNARVAFESCLRLAKPTGISDRRTRHCQLFLDRHPRSDDEGVGEGVQH